MPKVSKTKNGSSTASNRSSNDGETLCLTKTCRVCGDTALGYNFNVITCESCKAFFRRNAYRVESFQCPFENKCEITHVSRRFCQKCRLTKCFEVGMKKDHILTNEKLQQKRLQYKKRGQKGASVESPGQPSPSPSDSNHSSDVMQNLVDQTITTEVPPTKPKECQCKCNCGFYPAGTSFARVIETTITAQMALKEVPNSISSSVNSVVLPDFETSTSSSSNSSASCFSPGNFFTSEHHMQMIQRSHPSPPQVPTNDGSSSDDTQLISELKVASSILLEPVDGDANADKNFTIAEVIGMVDIAIRRLIQMSKRIAEFAALCQDDQIALLKGGCTEMMILRGAMTFEPDQGAWRPNRSQPISIKVEVLSGFNLTIYEGHKKLVENFLAFQPILFGLAAITDGLMAFLMVFGFLNSFDQSWRTNETIMLLLTAMILFDPTRPCIRHPEIVQHQYNRYGALLRRYLESNPTSFPSPSNTYMALISKLGELHQLNIDAVRYFLQIDPKEIGPLLIEIFDLR